MPNMPNKTINIQTVSTATQPEALDNKKQKATKKILNDLIAIANALETHYDLIAIANALEAQSQSEKATDKAFYDPTTEGSSYTRRSGLYAALDAVVSMILAIQSLQNSNTKLLQRLAEVVASQSKEENEKLEALAEKMQGETSKKDQGQLTADQTKFNTLMTEYNNKIQTSQTQVQNYSTLTSDQSKSIQNDSTQAQSIIGTMMDLARILA